MIPEPGANRNSITETGVAKTNTQATATYQSAARRRTATRAAALLVCLCVLFPGCSDKQKKTPEKKDKQKSEMHFRLPGISKPKEKKPQPTMADHIRGYRTWKLAKEEIKSSAHVGVYKDIYVNGIGEIAYQEASRPLPVGTIIIKESYSDGGEKKGELLAVSVMRKHKPGYNPKGGNWEYGELDPNLAVKQQGRIRKCMACHADISARDYVYTLGK